MESYTNMLTFDLEELDTLCNPLVIEHEVQSQGNNEADPIWSQYMVAIEAMLTNEEANPTNYHEGPEEMSAPHEYFRTTNQVQILQ